MRSRDKLQGGTDSEVTKLKEIWSGSDRMEPLPESQRDYWRSRFVSRDTQPALRAEIKQKLGVNLLYDSQLTRFRDWADEQLQRDLEAARQADDARRWREANPDGTKEELRESLLQSAYQRAKSSGDFKLGLAAMKQDKAFMEMFLDREKFAYLQKDDLEKALGALHAELKELPGGTEIYQTFETAIKAARARAHK